MVFLTTYLTQRKLMMSQTNLPLEAREVNDVLLQGILSLTIKKMEDNLYCRKILEGANYKKGRPSANYFDEEHFYLEKIYIGHGSDGPSGHCTKEKISETPNTPTRDAVYINENFAKSVVMDTLKAIAPKNSEAQKLISSLTPPPHSSVQKFMNYQEIFEFFSQNGRDRNGLNQKQLNDVWQYSQIRLSLLEKINGNNEFATDFLNITSDILLNTVAHECSHGNQMNKGMREEAKETKSLSGEKLKQKEQYLKDLLTGKISVSKRQLSREEEIIGRSEEAIAEAAVMAHSYIAFLATNPDKKAINIVNDFYNNRLSENKISSPSPEILDKMFSMKSKKYTLQAQKLQQKFARNLFTALLTDFGKEQMAKIDKDAKLDYNSKTCFDIVKGSYQEYIFGSVDEYISSIPSSGLNFERKKELKTFVSKRDNTPVFLPKYLSKLNQKREE